MEQFRKVRLLDEKLDKDTKLKESRSAKIMCKKWYRIPCDEIEKIRKESSLISIKARKK